MIKCSSIFRSPIRQLIGHPYTLISFQRTKNIELIHQLQNMQKESFKNFKSIAKDFWKQKYTQCLELEKSIVLIDDTEYLIDKEFGYLAEVK